MMEPQLRHLAIIMDGNGRWAKARGLPRLQGHKAGAEKLRQLCFWLVDRKIPLLSVYAFSTENWKRSDLEVQGLFQLIPYFFHQYGDELIARGLRIHFVGDLSALPPNIQTICQEVSRKRSAYKTLDLYICLNYGGRAEIIRAVNRWRQAGEPQVLTEATLQQYFDAPELMDPDLILRTGGEQRLSNFWLWQAAYSEFYVSPVYWPDFSEADLDLALDSFAKRQRRYGGRPQEREQP